MEWFGRSKTALQHFHLFVKNSNTLLITRANISGLNLPDINNLSDFYGNRGLPYNLSMSKGSEKIYSNGLHIHLILLTLARVNTDSQ